MPWNIKKTLSSFSAFPDDKHIHFVAETRLQEHPEIVVYVGIFILYTVWGSVSSVSHFPKASSDWFNEELNDQQEDREGIWAERGTHGNKVWGRVLPARHVGRWR